MVQFISRFWQCLFAVLVLSVELVMGLICYCENYCPQLDAFNGTCEVSANSYCFSAVELIYDPEIKNFKEFRTFGCLGPDESGLMQCRGYLTKHARPKNITCCREYNECNANLFPQLILEEDTTTPPETFDIVHFIMITATIVGILIFMACTLCYWNRKRIQQYFEYYKKTSKHPCSDFLNSDEKGYSSDMFGQSSGSGSGVSRLVQSTIGREIQLVKSIGIGRYGEVLLGKWRGDPYAVKVFSTTDEASWLREKEIYQTVLLRHENVLGFVAADITGNASCTQMLLITAYHELGSLYDYLKNNTLDHTSMLKMSLSIVSGLAHLHSDFSATKGKPGIAHRDIKSKNILVKRNRECCIADFGLAVKYSSHNDELDLGSNPKVGTRRYMAPEVLSDNVNVRSFESLRMADIYSFSLVLWEVCRRCVLDDGEKCMLVNEYQLPYYDCVSADPSVDDMYDVVCVKGNRPEISTRWSKDFVLEEISRIMKETWDKNPGARISALLIKKKLQKLQLHYQRKSNIV